MTKFLTFLFFAIVSAGSFAVTITHDDGQVTTVPAGYKVVLVPVDTPDTLVSVKGVKLIEVPLPQPDEDCPRTLVVGGSAPC